jgi:pSer/pThr/pTyr-binding forkhead associated (FHA) protein
MQVALTIYNPSETKQLLIEDSQFTIGRSASADLVLKDSGVSARHATIYHDGDRLWIIDEGSANGTTVDGVPVPPAGSTLYDGSEIAVGHDTTIVIGLQHDSSTVSATPKLDSLERSEQNLPESTGRSLSIPIIAGSLFALLVLVTVVVVASHVLRTNRETSQSREQPITYDVSPTETPAQLPEQNANTQLHASEGSSPQTKEEQSTGSQRLYREMTPQEQMEFIDEQARHISLMMGNRPYTFNDEVLRYIKQYLDAYAKRVGNNSTRLWAEDLRFMFARAREQYAPYIIRSFNARGVPPVVGLYLVVVETEYHNIRSENAAGAAGLFQFIGPTAQGYGVDPSERTNVNKMAPAAAAYMSDRIAEFGPDSMSVALAIAGYNRSPDSVRRDLRDVLNSENRERSFWTLVANSGKLDHYFQGENIKYVPKFFAAAIVGETPWAFGLQMQPLSTYTEFKNPPSATDGQ